MFNRRNKAEGMDISPEEMSKFSDSTEKEPRESWQGGVGGATKSSVFGHIANSSTSVHPS